MEAIGDAGDPPLLVGVEDVTPNQLNPADDQSGIDPHG
jgi:hypothetical protein